MKKIENKTIVIFKFFILFDFFAFKNGESLSRTPIKFNQLTSGSNKVRISLGFL